MWIRNLVTACIANLSGVNENMDKQHILNYLYIITL